MNTSEFSPEQLIKTLNLEPLEFEGGYFRRNYYAPDHIPAESLPERYSAQTRRFCSAIYYLLTDDPNSFSALHRLPTDEIYHFYLGDPVELLQLFADGTSRHTILGQDILNGQQVQYVAQHNIWQGSRLVPGGKFALLGTTMAPAFENSDFEEGSRLALIRQFPSETDLIIRLTRK